MKLKLLKMLALAFAVVFIAPNFCQESEALTEMELSSAIQDVFYHMEQNSNALEIENVKAPVNYVPYSEQKAQPQSVETFQTNPQSYKALGNFKLSFYCPCLRCNGNTHRITASGTKLTANRTIAVDKRIIPLGSKVYIEGFGEFIAEDTGSAINQNRIDVFVESHSEALRLGIKYANVYIKAN